MTLSAFILVNLVITTLSEYHLPSNIVLNATDANLYCTKTCGSYLATIHTEHEYIRIQNTISTNDTSWIQLNHNISQRTTIITQNVYQHIQNNIQTNTCFTINKQGINITNCNHKHSFICHSCLNDTIPQHSGLYE